MLKYRKSASGSETYWITKPRMTIESELMQIRDRIKELRRVKAERLRPNPKNWRTHPQSQQDALRGILSEIGYADALLAREMSDGSLELVDGHLRAETTPDAEVPVLILDLNEEESDKLLTLLDPLATMAQTDQHTLHGLIERLSTENEAISNMIDKMAAEMDQRGFEAQIPPEVEIPEAFQVVVECADEDDQKRVFSRLTADGLKCRLLTL